MLAGAAAVAGPLASISATAVSGRRWAAALDRQRLPHAWKAGGRAHARLPARRARRGVPSAVQAGASHMWTLQVIHAWGVYDGVSQL